jgi:hypothetical protein
MRRSQDTEHVARRVIDLSGVAVPFRLLRLANYWMVIGCGTWLIGQVVSAGSVPSDWWPYVVALWLVLVVNIWAGLRVAGRLNSRMWWPLFLALPLLAVGSGGSAWSLYKSLPQEIRAEYNPQGNALFVACVLSAIMSVSGICALAATIYLRRVRLGAAGERLADVLASLSEREQPSYVRARPANLTMGLLLGAGALVLLFIPHLIPDSIWQPYAIPLSLASLSGWAALFHARRYFQPDARSLLAVDTRKNILLLRSFVDDERHRYLRSELSVIDFGLETRLANHFLRYGPFVAIGSPRDRTPRPGAATAQLPNNEWQSVVRLWMGDAQTIVWIAGKTPWVMWELKQILQHGHQKKLIVMLPKGNYWFKRSNRRHSALRLSRISRLLAPMTCRGILDGITRPEDVRCIVLRPDGMADVFLSRSRSLDAFHLAVLIAHNTQIGDGSTRCAQTA